VSDDLTLPTREDARTIWVFTAALDAPGFGEFTKVGETWPLAGALGLPDLSPASVETFHTADLAGYGLERYLTEAHGMDPASVGPDTERLDALEGPVVLLFSRALPASTAKLDPTAPLAFVGRYDAPYELAPATPTSPRDATKGHLPGPAAGPSQDPGLLRRPLLITLAVLIALAGLVVLLA